MSSHPAFDAQIQAKVTACGVIAVLVIDEARDAVPLARALLAGGVAAMELTLRTAAALDALKAIRQEVLDKIIGTVPVKRLGEPSEIASIIAWLASDEGGYATGAEFSVNGGLHMG